MEKDEVGTVFDSVIKYTLFASAVIIVCYKRDIVVIYLFRQKDRQRATLVNKLYHLNMGVVYI